VTVNKYDVHNKVTSMIIGIADKEHDVYNAPNKNMIAQKYSITCAIELILKEPATK
jgi:hypothetical protein